MEEKKYRKICIYAICKNEAKFIPKWLDNVQEADYIVVLDTGSTDGSYEMLKNDKRITKVKKKEIKPWRFDVARNESMKLIPDDTDICFCIDMDELINPGKPGWAQILRDNWYDEDTRANYLYAWGHNDLGEPTDVFVYDKIHSREGYEWIFPVHEVLHKTSDFEEYILNACDAIQVHHYQDKSKPRSNYLPLLQLAVEENPTESHCRMMLAREYLLANDLPKALDHYKACLEYEDIKAGERDDTLREALGRIGDIYYALNFYNESITWFNKFMKMCPTYREPYFCIAQAYNAMGLYAAAEAMTLAGLKYSTRKYTWIERRDNWIAKADDILAVSYYHLGNLDEAIKHAAIAAEHNPNDLRIIKNYNQMLADKLKQLQPQE